VNQVNVIITSSLMGILCFLRNNGNSASPPSFDNGARRVGLILRLAYALVSPSGLNNIVLPKALLFEETKIVVERMSVTEESMPLDA